MHTIKETEKGSLPNQGKLLQGLTVSPVRGNEIIRISAVDQIPFFGSF
jgi:hypothetical protein